MRFLGFFKYYLFIIVVSTLALGCTQKREPRFEQGSGVDNLDALSDFQNKEFDLETGKEIGPTQLSLSSQVKISDKLADINNFGIVSYKTDAKLLGSIPLQGRENFKYKVRYVVSNKYLKIYKVGNKTDLSYKELPYAETLGDGQWGVPLVGYEIKGLYRIEKKLNEQDQETHRLIPIETKDLSQATHAKIDYNSRTVFEPVKMVDVFTANLFDGDWYYAETIVEASEENKSMIGSYLNRDYGFINATKIRFSKDSNKVRGININLDKRIDQTKDINEKNVFEIPVNWVDLRTAKNGSEPGLKGEVHLDNGWKDRKYVEVKFSEILTDEYANTSVNKLVDLEIDQDYFSFTISKTGQGIRTKYTFLKSGKRPYNERQYFIEDREKFGYYYNVQAHIDDYGIYRKSDIESKLRLNRFDPEKNIVFHFSASSPKNYREMARQVVTSWNETFAKSGAKSKVILDEGLDVQLGDLRYNTINLIDSLAANQLLGFGPSITDPLSGEIISATANIYIGPFRESMAGLLRRYILAHSSEDPKIKNLNHAGLTFLSAPIDNTSTPAMGEKFEASRFIETWIQNRSQEMAQQNLWDKERIYNNKKPCDYSLTGKYLSESIEAKCPEVLAYIEQLKANRQSVLENEMEVLSSCIEKLLPEKLMATLVHEMGHNFGLRHNFTASNDTANFYDQAVTQTKEVVRSSSAMDYVAFDEDRLIIPGTYDIAAIKYGYSNKVELKDGKDLSIDPKLNISKSTQGVALKPYKFCTDNDAEDGYWSDPLCMRHDAGTTPEELVDRIIHEFEASYIIHNFRWDRKQIASPEQLVASRVQYTYSRLHRIYEEWRYLLASEIGEEKKYLDDFDDPGSYEKFIKKTINSSKKRNTLNQYRKAAQKIFDFFSELAFRPNRYCIYSDGTKTDIKELELIRQEVYRASEHSVKSCLDSEDQILQEYLKSKKYQIIDEVGYSFSDMRYSKDIADIKEPLDVIGIMNDKMAVLTFLTRRICLAQKLEEYNDFSPNFLDEPPFRARILEKLKERIFDGVTLKTKTETIQNSIRFLKEKDFLTTFVIQFYNGLSVPEKMDLNLQRATSFRFIRTAMPNQIEGKMGVINMAPTYYVLAGSKEEFFNYKTLQKYQELDELSSFSADKANDKPNIGQYKNQVAPFVQSLKEFPDKETFLALSFSKYQSYMDQLTQNLKETGALGEALLQKLGDTGVAYTNQIKLFAGITQLKITQSGSYNDLINSLETDKKIPPATKKAILKSLDILPASSTQLKRG